MPSADGIPALLALGFPNNRYVAVGIPPATYLLGAKRGQAPWADGVKKRVDNLFQEMFDAVAKMPPVVIQAAEEAQVTENKNTGMWG
jgi:hypothetical protein